MENKSKPHEAREVKAIWQRKNKKTRAPSNPLMHNRKIYVQQPIEEDFEDGLVRREMKGRCAYEGKVISHLSSMCFGVLSYAHIFCRGNKHRHALVLMLFPLFCFFIALVLYQQLFHSPILSGSTGALPYFILTSRNTKVEAICGTVSVRQ